MLKRLTRVKIDFKERQDHGPQGKNETCDICTLKEKTMTHDDPEPVKHDLIDNSLYENINKYLLKMDVLQLSIYCRKR